MMFLLRSKTVFWNCFEDLKNDKKELSGIMYTDNSVLTKSPSVSGGAASAKIINQIGNIRIL